MKQPASTRLLDCFAEVSDPRRSNARHRLFDIFVIALCAVISGAEGWEDIEEYGRAQRAWFKTFLALPHGIPSHDTFRRVLSRLNPDELVECFVKWAQALRESISGETVSIDGKMLRRSFDRAAQQSAKRYIISVRSCGSRLCVRR